MWFVVLHMFTHSGVWRSFNLFFKVFIKEPHGGTEPLRTSSRGTCWQNSSKLVVFAMLSSHGDREVVVCNLWTYFPSKTCWFPIYHTVSLAWFSWLWVVPLWARLSVALQSFISASFLQHWRSNLCPYTCVASALPQSYSPIPDTAFLRTMLVVELMSQCPCL